MFSLNWVKVAVLAALTFVCSIVHDVRQAVDGLPPSQPVPTNSVPEIR